MEYSDYDSVVNLLQKSDNGNAYQDLMIKEKDTLDKANNVIKYYNDRDYEKKQFINMSFYDTLMKTMDVFNDITSDIIKVQSITDFKDVMTKKDRLIYIGVLIVILSLFIFFII